MKFPVKLTGIIGELIQAVATVIGIVSMLSAFGALLGGDYRICAFMGVVSVVLLYVFYPREPKTRK